MFYLCRMIRKKVREFIESNLLFGAKDKVLVALSGGADSVALLRVLMDLGYSCLCAHCNFHLRGEESDRDEQFVRQLCDGLSIPLHVRHFDTTGHATRLHISIEMSARVLRYEWFDRLRKETGASVIAVAHHRDDSVETFLINLIRGTGINGLKGISARNGFVVRPLLETNRQEILEYLEAVGQDYVTDSTNLQDEYLRNKIRLNLLPLMRELNPSVAESISETSMRLTEVAAIYNKERAETLSRKLEDAGMETKRISIASVSGDIAPLSLLHEMLYPLGFNASQVKDVLRSLKTSQSGKVFRSKEWSVLRDRDYLWIRPVSSTHAEPELLVEEVPMTPTFTIPRTNHIACLDADTVSQPIVLRKWQQGDKFVPFGMRGKKKVSDYLTDRKFTQYQKEQVYVACSGEDIVWLAEERTDNRFRITDKTKRVLILRVKAHDSGQCQDVKGLIE